MTAQESLQRIINTPTAAALGWASGVAAALFLIAFVLLLRSGGRRKWSSGFAGFLGFATLMVVLGIIIMQTVRTRESESVTVTRPRYPEDTRSLARGAMFGLPGAIVLGAVIAWGVARRRMRSRLPRHLKDGRSHLFQKEYDAALAQFNRAIQIAPHLAEAYRGRGSVYHAMGDLPHALADFDRAIEADPRLASAYVQRAKIRTETGDLDGALADFERLLSIRATDPELYLNRGICLIRKGQVHDAADDFRRVLKLTNHSDFADPAREYLKQIESPGDTALRSPSAEANGVPPSNALPEIESKDYII